MDVPAIPKQSIEQISFLLLSYFSATIHRLLITRYLGNSVCKYFDASATGHAGLHEL